MTSTEQLVPLLQAAVVLPVVRADDPASALRRVDLLVSVGVTAIELTTTVPDWLDVLKVARARHSGALIGMGTVLDISSAEAACEEGADFLVTPWPVDGVHHIGSERGVAVVSGGFTPSEIHAAAQRGIAKLFPAHVGGPQYVRSLRAVLPQARVVPTGGISVRAVAEWIAAGAIAVGVGNDLFGSGDLAATIATLRKVTQGADR